MTSTEEANEDGPLSPPTLHSRLESAANTKRTEDAQDSDELDNLSDSELFDELERELEEEEKEGRGGAMGRLREERMNELKRQ